MTDTDLEVPASGETDGRLRGLLPAGSGLGRAFKRIWLALTVSLMGSEITALAIPLLAAVTLDASPFEVGIVGAATSLPFLLFSLPAGVLVDMLPRRPVMVTSDIASALALTALPVAWAIDAISIPLLCAVGFVVSTCAVSFEIAHYAFVPSLVPGNRMVDANSRLQMSYSAADWAGPGVAGALIRVLTAPIAVIVDALTFVVSALLLGSVKGAEPQREETEERPTIRQALVDGLQFLLHERTLRPVILLASLGMIFNTALAAVTVLYFVRELGLQPSRSARCSRSPAWAPSQGPPWLGGRASASGSAGRSSAGGRCRPRPAWRSRWSTGRPA